MTERAEGSSENGTPEPTDYNKMTLDELEAEFDAPRESPDPEPTPVEEPPESEGEPGTAEEAGEEEPAAEAEETEPEFDERSSQIEELQLRLQQAELDRNHERDVASRNAGMLGHLQKQIQQMQQQPPQPRADDFGGEPAEIAPMAPQPSVDPQLQSTVAELAQAESNRAVVESYNDIRNQIVSDLQQQGFAADDLDTRVNATLEKMAPAITEGSKAYEGMTLNVKAQRQAADTLLKSAYIGVKIDEMRTAREEALAKRAAQVPERKRQKLAASSAGGGGASAAPSRPKRPSEMTSEEADAEMVRLFGDGSSNLRGDR